MVLCYLSGFRNSSRFNFFSKETVSGLLLRELSPAFLHARKCNYVDVYMKWKKDSYYDSIESIHKSIELKPLLSLKNCIAKDPNGCIPISAVSKRGPELGVPMKVARFLRLYPSVFEEYTGPHYNLPWFRLTAEAVSLDREERAIFEDRKTDIRDRLKKLILMSREKRLPLKIIQGMLWYLGLPDDFLKDPEANLDGSFRFVEMEDDMKGLAVDSGGKVLSVLQKNAINKGIYSEGSMGPIEFPLFPSKNLRLKRKISDWLEEFQKLPYISPYEDFSHLNPSSDLAEKRVVAVIHELLSLFVEHSAERKRLLCLRKYLGLPQKFHKAFERHPHMFYLSLRNKTCTAILKEAYNTNSAIDAHPLSNLRKKYIKLIKESAVILKQRRLNNRPADLRKVERDLDLDPEPEAPNEDRLEQSYLDICG